MEKKLKKAYLDEGKRDQILAEIEKDRQRLNACVSELNEGSGISIDDVEVLKAISVEWCRNYVKEAEAGYLKNLSPFVVKTVQSDVHERFRDSYGKAAPLCSEIRSILNRRRFNVKMDSKGHFWFDEKETKPMAAEAATIHYSDDEIEFCDKLAEIIDKINDFEKWAELKGFEPFFTKQRCTIWNGGTSTNNIVSLLTDTELTSIGAVNTKNHLTFNADVFRDLMRKGYISQNR